MTSSFDAIVLGAGAAGLMCALQAGRRGRRVAVLEHAPRPGKKILISGGGRCNFTNLHCRPENFLSANPHFCKSALARYTPADFLALVEKHHIPYHEKTLGQLFCDRSARDIVDLLERECSEAGVQLFLNASITGVRRDTAFEVSTPAARFRAPALVVATGGLSIPKMGATGLGYELARQFGLNVIEPRPALVPLVLGPEDRGRYCALAGVSFDTIASARGHQFREKALITHRGLSGPAILQVSSYWEPGLSIALDLAPDRDLAPSFQPPLAPRTPAAARLLLRSLLPARFADVWLEANAPARWNDPALSRLHRLLHHWPLVPTGTEGFDKAEVTAGGVDTSELSARSFEARKVPALFFIGEVVDVTGHLGGFSFQWAWASGYAAGQFL
jgi:predicted Rossmann fold flavoprotein